MTKNPFNLFENEAYSNLVNAFSINGENVLSAYKKNFESSIQMSETLINSIISIATKNNDYISKLGSLISELSTDTSFDYKKKQEMIKTIMDEIKDHNNSLIEMSTKAYESNLNDLKKKSSEVIKDFESFFTTAVKNTPKASAK